MKISSIKQGESLPFEFDLGGEELTGWVCVIFVKQYPSDIALIERTIPAEGRTWPGYLTSTETAALDPSSRNPYQLIGVLTNASDDQESQEPIRFNVTEAWA